MPRPSLARRKLSFWLVCGLSLVASVGCEWDPAEPFQRYAPAVDRGIALLNDGGDAKASADIFEEYLLTGACDDGTIATPQRVHDKPHATFDLGLAIFRIGELYGKRFGAENEPDKPGAPDISPKLRELQSKCANTLATAIAKDTSVPWDLRSRAYYLLGNLAFLQGNYTEAIESYDEALRFAPAQDGDAGVKTIGKDAAWNRAIALRRKDESKDAGQDANEDGSTDASPDARPDASPDGGDGGGKDASPDGSPGDGGKGDGGESNGEGDAGGKDAGQNQPPDAGSPPNAGQDAGAPPPQGASLDERMLDELERIPNVQKESAKIVKRKRRPTNMEDK